MDHPGPPRCGEPATPAAQPPGSAVPRPRPPWARSTLAIAIWLGVGLLPRVLADTLWPTDDPLLEAGPFFVEDAAELSVLAVMVVYGWLATRVSYRWFDALFLLVPLYNLVWSARIAWRVALLPYCDWEPRADEAGGWVPVGQSPSYPSLLHVRRPRR